MTHRQVQLPYHITRSWGKNSSLIRAAVKLGPGRTIPLGPYITKHEAQKRRNVLSHAIWRHGQSGTLSTSVALDDNIRPRGWFVYLYRNFRD